MVEDEDVPGVPGFLSVKEAADLIKLSESRVYELIRKVVCRDIRLATLIC